MKALILNRMHALRSATAARFAALLTLFALALPATLLAQGPGTAAYRQGLELQKAGDHNGAIAKFNEAINLERNNYRYYYRRGESEMRLRKYNEAVQSYRQAAVLNKDYTAANVKMAMAYIRLKNNNGAIQALNAAYDSEKDANRKLTYKIVTSKLLVRANRPQEALAEINKIKATAGEDPRVLAAEGDIYAAQNNWQRSIDAYNRAVEKMKGQPASASAKYYYGLGLAYFKAGDTAKADEAWKNLAGTPYARRAQALKQTSGATYNVGIASGYLRANLVDDAIEYANKAVQAEPNNSVGYQVLAMAQLRKGQTAQAINNMNKAADLQKDEARKTRLYSSIVSMQFRNGDYAGALNTANKILAKTPNNSTILALKAQAEYQLGQFQNAIATAERAIAAANKDPNKVAAAQFTQGLAAKRAGDLERARQAFAAVSGIKSVYRLAARVEAQKLQGR